MQRPRTIGVGLFAAGPPPARQIWPAGKSRTSGDVSVDDVFSGYPVSYLSGGGQPSRPGGYTRVLLNGEPAPPNFDLNNLNPSQVKRIEVARAATADQRPRRLAAPSTSS